MGSVSCTAIIQFTAEEARCNSTIHSVTCSSRARVLIGYKVPIWDREFLSFQLTFLECKKHNQRITTDTVKMNKNTVPEWSFSSVG